LILYFYLRNASQLPLLVPLELVDGEIFTRRLEHYFKASLRKCLPNIHVTLRPIYSDTQKRNELEQLALRLCEYLEKNQTMEEDGERESPACLVWLYHFLAQHFDFLKNYEMALHYVNLAMEHTPTITDLYVTKGRIYKHAGHIKYAAACLDEAQSLGKRRFLSFH
jgi:N-alpha-acetyltransferase 15/16, NatA auxiliary subunit